jgi:hypothetical protein
MAAATRLQSCSLAGVFACVATQFPLKHDSTCSCQWRIIPTGSGRPGRPGAAYCPVSQGDSTDHCPSLRVVLPLPTCHWQWRRRTSSCIYTIVLRTTTSTVVVALVRLGSPTASGRSGTATGKAMRRSSVTVTVPTRRRVGVRVTASGTGNFGKHWQA